MKRILFIFAFCLFLVIPSGALASTEAKIIGGHTANSKDWPFFVSLFGKDPSKNSEHPFCGGSLIDEHWILTAAHCVEIYDRGTTYVPPIYVNLSRPSLRQKGGTVRKITSVYLPNNWQQSGGDAALLYMEKAVGEKPALLASSSPAAGSDALVAGFGITEFEDISQTLLETDVKIVSDADCNTSYGDSFYAPTMICAASPGKDSCQGDSGGPLTSSGLLVGIVSWGEGCAETDYPGVYTRVSSIRNWSSNTISSPPRETLENINMEIDVFQKEIFLRIYSGQLIHKAYVRYKQKVCIKKRCFKQGRRINLAAIGGFAYHNKSIYTSKKCLRGKVSLLYKAPGNTTYILEKSFQVSCKRA